MKLFDLEYIMDLSNRSSFEKGEDYYNSGCVKKIIKKGNTFEGTVIGSSAYKVTLDISDDEPDFECSCPYDYDGICKHSVALAMAVLDGNYENESEKNVAKENLHPEVFKERFINTDNQKKLSFLKQLLDKDTELQNQFVVFAQSKSDVPALLTFVNIDEVRDAINVELTSIDFDDIVENFNPYDEGYYDDEGYIDEAYDEIRNVLYPYTERAVKYYKNGNLTDGTKILMGMYEGIQNLPDIEDSDYEVFGDSFENEVYEIFKEEFKKSLSIIEEIVKSQEQIEQVFDLLFQRFELFENKKSVEDNSMFHLYIKFFEKLFIAFLIDPETAAYIFNLIQKKNLCNSISTSFVTLKIAEILKNEKLWIDTAEKHALLEPDISKQLLEKYKNKNELKDFNRISELAFSRWPDKFNLYLIDNLDKVSEKALYLKALTHYVTHTHSIKYYKVLREYLSEDQRIIFVNKAENTYNDLYYIQLLEIEKRFADILKYARKAHEIYYGYEKVLNPIANIYPEECFEIIKNKCDSALKSNDKNRKTYQRMVNWLNVMVKITSKQTETENYIKLLYNFKPNLPALKDELRKQFGVNYLN